MCAQGSRKTRWCSSFSPRQIQHSRFTGSTKSCVVTEIKGSCCSARVDAGGGPEGCADSMLAAMARLAASMPPDANIIEASRKSGMKTNATPAAGGTAPAAGKEEALLLLLLPSEGGAGGGLLLLLPSEGGGGGELLPLPLKRPRKKSSMMADEA